MMPHDFMNVVAATKQRYDVRDVIPSLLPPAQEKAFWNEVENGGWKVEMICSVPLKYRLTRPIE